MREIEFRGKKKYIPGYFGCSKDKKDGEWVYGDLERHRIDELVRIHSYSEDKTYYRQYDVDPNTVGQFTGLLDKNGKKIYEGDIIFAEFSDKSSGYSIVGWNEETASFGLMDSYSYESKREGYDFPEFKNNVLLAFLEKTIVFEVSGNIHDTPELLENK